MKSLFKTPSSVGSGISRKRRLTQLTGIDLNETDISWTESLATPSTLHPAKWGKSVVSNWKHWISVKVEESVDYCLDWCNLLPMHFHSICTLHIEVFES